MSTPGPWALRGRQIRAENGVGKHVADYMVDAEDGRLIAAAPELLAIVERFTETTNQEQLYDLHQDAVGLLVKLRTKEPWED